MMCGEPNAALLIAPHSPFAAGFNRLQSGVRFPLLSFHVLVTLFTEVFSGLLALAMPTACRFMNFPMAALTDVLPLPKRSYAAPIRGLMSFQHGTHGTGAYVRAGTNSVTGMS